MVMFLLSKRAGSKYSRRLFLWLLCYSIVLVGCFVGYQYHREKEFKTVELNGRLQVINYYILDEIADGKDIRHISLGQRHEFSDLRVSVIDTSGNVIYDNGPETNLNSNHLSRREIRNAHESGSGYTVRRHSETTGKTYFYSATRGDDGVIVRTAVPYSVSLSELLSVDTGFLWIMGAVTILMCVLGYIATRRIGLHILRLNRFAESAERGERIYDTAPFPDDELGAISNHIVRLYANQQQAVSERDREHKHAIFQQQEKERIKKQLTNNINHELKTPVASIRVCLEILMRDAGLTEEKRREFLKRCFDNTERLRHLLNDVAVITRMDDAPDTISREVIDIAEVATQVADEYDLIADGKNISIVREISGPLMVSGNRNLLESIFQNLLDNALAYSGGTSVSLKLFRAGNNICVIVYDDGCGVPPEHLPQLFERFYRLDKGRSRAAGGTGLGLSIVNNAVQFHGGRITVANRRSGGLQFTILFPLDAEAL